MKYVILEKAQVQVKQHVGKRKGKLFPVKSYVAERKDSYGLKFDPKKMKALIAEDRFLQKISDKGTKPEVIFNTYVLGDSVMEDRYDKSSKKTLADVGGIPGYKLGETQEQYEPKVAATIADQMGGIKSLKTMIGAKNFIDHGNALSFEFPSKGKKPNYLKITLDPSDTYTMEFGRKKPLNPEKVAALPENVTPEQFRDTFYTKIDEISDVYADDLQEIFEEKTGLYLSLFPQHL